MSFGNVLRAACSALWRNRLRTGLTLLGITIGIGAVICTVALGAGSEAQIHEQLLAIGDNLVWVENGNRNVAGVRTGAGGYNKLTAEDMQAIVDEVPEVTRCGPQVDARAQIVFGNQNWGTQFRGTNPDYLPIKKWVVTRGTSLTDADVESRATVTVLGSVVAERLFGTDDPLGQQIRIGRVPFTVVGILGSKGQSVTGQDQDDTLFIPYTTAIRYFKGDPYLDDIMCSAVTPDAIPLAQANITEVMRRRHKIAEGSPDDFTLRAPDAAVQTREDTNRTLGIMLASVASVSLVVGGVGIMNIMLVSVAERTREIGLRLAIGARERDVRMQFLTEALLLGLAGGVLGVLAGEVSSSVLANWLGWRMVVTGTAILVAVGFASVVGLIFGYVPAANAAKLDPIEALRDE
jgi:putative ABC transport system permease protein